MSDEGKPFIRWAGSKKKLVPQLSQYWNDTHKRYIEPFMGSAQLFYALDAPKAVLSDINQELVEAYIEVKNNPIGVYQRLVTLPQGESEYYKIRSLDISTLNQEEKAARFIYLNKFCFNGLYRTNLSGKFNVPYSNSKIANLPSKEAFMASSQKLKKVKLVHGDFEKVIKKNARQGDFIYLDPPYAVENRRIFHQYGPQTFGIEDLKRLQQLLEYLNENKIDFLLSYAYCKEALEIFKQWNKRKIFTQRNIAGFSKHRRKAAELLITNID